MSARAILPTLCILAALGALASCASLPEPESRGAQLYTQFCSGSGCHGPIPPGRSTIAVWEMQYDRMLGTMREARFPLPNAAQTDTIMAYLGRHAEGAGR